MKRGLFFKKLSAFFFVPSMFLVTLCGYYSAKLPDKYYVYHNDTPQISTVFPITAEYDSVENTYSGNVEQTYTANASLFGIIPVKCVEIESIDKKYLIPGGEAFGIKIMSDGVMVVSISDVDGVSPAAECGLCVGDVITQIDGRDVATNDEVQNIIAQSDGDELDLTVLRSGEEYTLTLVPEYSREECEYCAGIWVRDSSAGIGTVTFYNPQNKLFGGLGHAVCDSDTDEIVPLLSGKVSGVEIFGIKKSLKGSPGELQGRFVNEDICGLITENNDYGVFGELSEFSPHADAVELGLKQDIEIGEAVMLTTIDGNSPQEYSIYIKSIDFDSEDGLKSIVIEVTDEELLEKCGGIVRGMSGSPVLQNGKLVAAVTHVFVNDPKKGYAVFAETMIDSME